MNEHHIEDLAPTVDDQPEQFDHPDELTDEESEQGLAEYLKVDDTDDESGGEA